MTISFGIEYSKNLWQSCVIEQGQVLECLSFGSANAILAYLEHMCTLYPEPVIALSSDLQVPLSPLNMLLGDVLQSPALLAEHDDAFYMFLTALNTINFRNFVLPGIAYLESIPPHRKLYRGPLGGAARLCRIATLLYRLRMRNTIWSDMCFLYLEVGDNSSSVAIVKEGKIVDAIGIKTLRSEALYATCESAQQEGGVATAFWEMLTQDLAGLMVLYHCEDIVLAYDYLSPPQEDMKKALLDRFADLYQFYLYPPGESEPDKFVTAMGAAILAEGLSCPGLAAQVVEKLL